MFEAFIEHFGEWKVAEDCTIENLPFIEDIELFFERWEAPLKEENLEKDLMRLINMYSLENESNTPDFILAGYLINCLDVFNKTINRRSKWYRCPTEKPTIK